MGESTQHKLDRVRPPRVQITYDVQTGDAIEKKELPFVVGIMADLAGDNAENLPRLKDRKFVNLDPDNINDVMEAIAPSLSMRVDDKLTNEEGKQINVSLSFNSMDDFEPINIVKQIEPLRKLYEARQRLNDLLAKLDGNDALDSILQDVIQSTENLKQLNTMLGENGDGKES